MEDNAKSLPYLASMSYPYSILSNTSAPNYFPKSAPPPPRGDRSHPPSPPSASAFAKAQQQQQQHQQQQQQQQQARYPYRHHPAMGYPPKAYHPSSSPYASSYPYLSYLHPLSPHYYASSPSSFLHSRSAKLQELSNRLQSWKTISIGLSFLALILLTCKLYDVDREINYLQHISHEWLSPEAINRDLLNQSPSSPSSSSSQPHSSPGVASPHSSQTKTSPPGPSSSPLATAHIYAHHNVYSLNNSAHHRDDDQPMGTIIGHGSFHLQPQHRHQHPHQHHKAVDEELVTSDFDKNVAPIALPLVSGSLSGSGSSSTTRKSNDKSKLLSSSSSHRPKTTVEHNNHHHNNNNNHNHQLDELHIEASQLSAAQSLPQMLDAKMQSTLFLIENFREDIDILIVELWSSRTTLVLSLVFVFVYIISWCWMAYAIRQTTTPQDISLKTVLLLAIFAAVDIAASAGFVMVRIIMYVMRDYYFPRDMRVPILTAEFNQMASYAALRLVTLKSGTGVVDIFVSVIVGFLTSLRVYSVVCAVAFYRRAKKEILNVSNLEYMLEKTSPRQLSSSGHYPAGLINGGAGGAGGNHLKLNPTANIITKPSGTAIITNGDAKHEPPNGFLPKMRMLSAHRDLDRRFSIMVEEESSSSDEDPANELNVQAADMPASMQKSAIQSTVHALRTYTTEKHIAESIKQNFDQLYQPTWHCIVGRNWGSCVTHTKSNYIRMLYKDLTILLYKSS